MPPKKKETKKKNKDAETESLDYDMDVMTIEELRKYAHMLENGIEEMRKHCSFYQSAEDKLAGFYRARQKDIASKDELLLEKDVALEDLRLKVQMKIEESQQKNIYEEFALSEKLNRKNLETKSKIEELADQHKTRQNHLSSCLLDMEKELAAQNRRIQLNRKETLENNSQKLKELVEYEKYLLAKCVEDFKKMLTDASSEFSLAMKSIESESTEAKRIAEEKFRNTCLSYKENLQNYFKNINEQDLKDIEDLKQKVSELEKEITKKKLILKKTLKQNDEMKNKHQKQRTRKIFSKEKVKTNVNNNAKLKVLREQKKMENLVEENQNLEIEIEKVEEEANNLRNQFTKALCKVRASAELKAVILEKKMDHHLKNNIEN